MDNTTNEQKAKLIDMLNAQQALIRGTETQPIQSEHLPQPEQKPVKENRKAKK